MKRLLLCLPLVITAALAWGGLGQGGGRGAQWLERKFAQLDADADGKLTPAELPDAEWFARLDGNKDGAITREEARAALANFKPQPAENAPVAAPAPAKLAPPQQGPRLLPPFEYGVGELVPNLTVASLGGPAQPLSAWQGGQPLVLALVSPTCLVGKRYLPTLAVLQKEYAARGVRLLPVSLGDEPTEAVQAALRIAGLAGECLVDPAPHPLARALHAMASTDCVVLDAARTLVYRGAIDDQYGLGYSLEAPRQQYLQEALRAVLAGERPTVQATEAPGCVLDLGTAPAAATIPTVTYHNRISRLLQSHCVECHRADGAGPFPLETLPQVSAKAGMIRRMVEGRLMPPWFAAPTTAGAHTPWLNDRSLSEADRTALLGWLAAGRPEGDVAEAPRPRRWPAEWVYGQPDATLQIPQAIAVKATGTMPYQHVRMPTAQAEDRWVRGFEVKPTARQVVHHVLVFVVPPGQRKPGNEDNYLAAYVPGNSAVLYPQGFAKRLPAGSELIFQIHYTPNGEATTDQVQLGLYFAKEAPSHEIKVASVANHRLLIPPGEANHQETASLTVPANVRLLSFMPHMHVRGKAFRYEVVAADGSAQTLLEVPRYDFNWQLGYRLAEPLPIARGAKLRATAWFDNSAGNPANPDPTATVKWGPQTTEEMMLGYVEYYVES